MRTFPFFLLLLVVLMGLAGCAFVQEVPQHETEYIEASYTGQVSSESMAALEEEYPPGFWEDQNIDQGEPATVTVSEFVTHPARPDLGRTFADMVASSLVQSGRVTVVEREQLKELLQELELSQTGLTQTPSDYATGNMHVVRFVISGTVSRIGGRERLEARLLDVLSSQVVASEVLTVDQINVAAANALANMLLGKISQQ